MTADGLMAPTASAPSDVPNVDCFDCIPDYEPLRTAVAQNDWSLFRSTLDDWAAEEVTHALYLMSQQDDEQIQSFAVDHADDPVAKVAVAYRHVTLGWRARSNAMPDQVSEQQWAVFRRELARAEQCLVEACAIDPSFAPAWTARVLTARALSLPVSEARRRHTRLQRAQGDFWGHMHFHQYLEPKWFGSLEQAREFVDTALVESHDGSLTGVLVPLFHLERWFEKGDDNQGAAYLRGPEVQDELDAAARRSVLHPARHVLTPSTAAGHQIFLSVYWLAGQKAKAAVHRSALGSRTTDHNWELLTAGSLTMAAIWNELTRIGESNV